MGLMRGILLWASQSQRLRETLPRYHFMRNAVKRFMPGDEAQDALNAAEDLRRKGFSTVFTFLGENVLTAAEAEKVAKHYCDLLDQAQSSGLDCHISVKLTQLGHDLTPSTSDENLKVIADHAKKLGHFVWIDMEGSAYTESTIQLFERIRPGHSNVGLCLQAYLYRTEADIRRLAPLRPALRLVKGAYAEPSTLAFPKKKDVDINYVKCAAQLLNGATRDGIWPVLGTHDKRILLRIQDEAKGAGISNNAFEFHFLYGIKPEEQRRLLQEGNQVRVLISYGTYWFPWYMRRLAERPANVLFVLRNLFG